MINIIISGFYLLLPLDVSTFDRKLGVVALVLHKVVAD